MSAHFFYSLIDNPSLRRIYFFRGVPQLASLVEMITQIVWDMANFIVILFLLIAGFGLSFFALHSTNADEVQGSFSTLPEALLSTVRATDATGAAKPIDSCDYALTLPFTCFFFIAVSPWSLRRTGQQLGAHVEFCKPFSSPCFRDRVATCGVHRLPQRLGRSNV